jgi:cell division protein FtsL
MLRFVNLCLLLGLLTVAYVIYEVKYASRGLEEEIAVLKKDIEAERDSIAVLRAEWSLLNRPERIERLALKYLNLARARPNQLVALEGLKDSDFARQQIEAANTPSATDASTTGAVAKVAERAEAPKQKKTPVLAGAVVIPRALSAR